MNVSKALLTQEEKRIKIAQATIPGICGPFGCYSAPELSGRVNGEEWIIPDYFNDLNAMHEAEKIIFETYDRSKWFCYLGELQNVCCCGGNATHEDHVHASAGNRAEAFGRAMGLWKAGLT